MPHLSGKQTTLRAPESVLKGGGGVTVLRAFSPTSWWNTPLDAGLLKGAAAPVDPNNAAMLAAVQAAVSKNYLVLTGTPSNSPDQAQPVYRPVTSDHLYHIVPVTPNAPTVDVRIPAGAKPNGGASPKMSILDTTTNQAVGLTGAAYNAGTDTWTADGTDRYYLDSDGVADSVGGRAGNTGHRGATFAEKSARIAEVNAGSITHRLEGFVRPYKVDDTLGLTGDLPVWPMTGSDGDPPGGLVPEGIVLRIKKSVSLGAKGLTPAALVIATCLQKYGLVITDGGGVNVTHRLEWADPFGDPTWQQAAWTSIGINGDSLISIPLSTDWEFVQGGYRPLGATP